MIASNIKKAISTLIVIAVMAVINTPSCQAARLRGGVADDNNHDISDDMETELHLLEDEEAGLLAEGRELQPKRQKKPALPKKPSYPKPLHHPRAAKNAQKNQQRPDVVEKIIIREVYHEKPASKQQQNKPGRRPPHHPPKNNNDYTTHIVGGNQANLGEYPFFANLNGCGGSLIGPRHVLTAAHCVEGGSIPSAVIGSYQNGVLGNGAVQRSVVRTTSHPSYSYNSQTADFDFAILELNSDVANKPIRLNKNSNVPATGSPITVIGFGATSENGPGSNFLQEVVVNAFSHDTCVRQYGSGINRNIHLCAGVQGGGKDSCQNDSGGPIFEFVNGEPVQVGVVSFGIGCARATHAGVYARVSGVISWIEQTISSTGPNPAPGPGPNPVPAPGPNPVPAPAPTGDGGFFPTPTNGDFVPTPTNGDFVPTTAGDDFWPTAGWFRRTQETESSSGSGKRNE